MSEYHGHVTHIDGSHSPLSEEDAKAIWDAAEQAKAGRAATMPNAQSALSAMIDAKQRMQELGWWLGGGLRVKRGDECAVAETGSTGIFKGWVDDDGQYVHYAGCVSSPRKCFLKPLADLSDDERAHMERCDRNEALAYEAEINRFAAIDACPRSRKDQAP